MDNNINIENQTISFDIVGRQPTQEEAAVLTSTPIKKKPASSAEIKDALKWFAVGIGVSLFAWFFGRWVISRFAGPGVLIFGYGAAYAVAPISIIWAISSFCKIFRSAQKKTPKEAIDWVYRVSYFGDDGVGVRFGKLEYAVSTIARIVPDSMAFDAGVTRDYITRFRKTLTDAMDSVKAKKQLSKDWSEGRGHIMLTVDETQELYPNVQVLHAKLSYTDVVTRSDSNNKTTTQEVGNLVLNITNTFVKAGQYWFPFDIYPEIIPTEESTKANEDSTLAEL